MKESDHPQQFWIVRSGDTTVSGLVLTGNFPDYERVMPHYEGQPARLAVSELLSAIDAVYHAADERSHAIQLHFNCTSLKLIASTVGGASASIEIPCDTGVAHGVTVGLNADYVKDFAKSLPKNDDVLISCAGLAEVGARMEKPEYIELMADNDRADGKRKHQAQTSAWGFSSASDPGYQHVIMPMRI